jgi:hypothetical protein
MANNFTAVHQVRLKTETCIKCGVLFAMPSKFRAHLYRLGGFFYCPAGHSQGWSEGEEERERKDLRLKLEAKERELEAERKRKEWAQNDAKQQAAKLARLQKRAAAGTCPCCNRTFKQLVAHMKNKHPDVAPEPNTSFLHTRINSRAQRG